MMQFNIGDTVTQKNVSNPKPMKVIGFDTRKTECTWKSAEGETMTQEFFTNGLELMGGESKESENPEGGESKE